MNKTKSQTDIRGTHWILTWNNPMFERNSDRAIAGEYPDCDYKCNGCERCRLYELPARPEDVEHMINDTDMRNVWEAKGQLEKGKDGTPHIQFYLKTPQVRWSAVKKQYPQCHIELSKTPWKVESYCSKLNTRVSASTQTDKSQTDGVDEKYTTKMFWEDLARIWPDFRDVSEDEMECFDCATRCLIDIDIPCWMLAVQPQVRKAFQLYGHRIMAQYARKDEPKNIYETAASQESDGELYESESSDCSSEGSEEGDSQEEDCSEASEQSDDSSSGEDSEG